MSAGPPKLTVAVVVAQATPLLNSTLASAQPLADEMLVIDAAACDSLAAVSQRYAARHVRVTWDEDFSAARNIGLRQASGDWLLWLEPGETVPLPDAERLRRFIDQSVRPATAYRMLVRQPGDEERLDGEQISQLRLQPKHDGLRFQGRVCESLEPALSQLGMTVESRPDVILCPCEFQEARFKTERARLRIRLAEREIGERRATAQLLNCLGDAYHTVGQPGASRRAHQQALELSQPGSPELLDANYGLLTALEGTDTTRELQTSVCLETLRSYPLDGQLLCAMGGYLQAQGRLDLAARSYESAWRYGQVEPQVWHLQQLREFAALCFSLSLELQQRESEAQQVLEETLALHDAPRLRRQLLQFYVKRAQVDQALVQVDALADRTPQPEQLREAVRGACLASQKDWTAARECLLRSYRAGCRDPLCLRWLVRTLLATGDAHRVAEVLDNWQILQPENPEILAFRAALQRPPTVHGKHSPLTGRHVATTPTSTRPTSSTT